MLIVIYFELYFLARNLSLNQCSEFDDIQASPGILEMDLTRLDENYSHFPALIYSPDGKNFSIFFTLI